MTVSAGFIWENARAAAGLLMAMARGERAQTLAEYGLLLTLVGVGVVVPTVILMRTALAGTFSDVTDCISRVTC
ncbi:MAG: hypothetical protein J4N95_06770 [Chloroflexi bacterium]|nr:hypothetical protein [Chloroflexota bacterium]